MESFLSLPRSAKGGLAVLLAIALLGWAIVAYSAKRQHDDARSLENALATLESRDGREEQAVLELKGLQERLTAAEAELASSRETVAVSHQAKSDAEAKIAELESALAARPDPSTAPSGETSDADASTEGGGALALLDTRDGADATQTGAGEAGQADADRLRARLTETMTTLSARSAMLQQRERELDRAKDEVERRTAEVADLQSAAVKEEATRARLNGMMTTLSAKSAMLQQREREVERANADRIAAEERIAALEESIADRDETGRSLEAMIAKLDRTKQALNEGSEALEKNQQALDEQNARMEALKDEQTSIIALLDEKQAGVNQQEERFAALSGSIGEEEERLAATQAEIEAAKAELADLEVALEDRDAESSSLTAEFESLEAALSEKEDAIAAAEAEFVSLTGDIAAAAERLAAAESEFQAKRSTLNAQDVEIQGAEASLAALKADRAVAEAESIELKSAIGRQQSALEDLAALKGEIDATKAELARQTALLDEKNDEVAAVGSRLQEAGKETTARSSNGLQSLPRIAIAELGEDNLAVLPIDPMQTPLPVQTENGVRLTLVHFDLGSAELTPGGMRRAKEAAAWIKQQDSDDLIRLIGATDTIGTREDNMVLAKRRAQSLLKVFADEGIDPDRIELISKGEDGGSEKIADQTAEPLNRCVGVFIGG